LTQNKSEGNIERMANTDTSEDSRLTSVRLPKDLHWLCKAQAALQRMDTIDWYERALRRAIEQEKAAS
jgi:hypothetical protein